MTSATNRRAVLGAVLAAGGALASLPSPAAASVATGLEAEPELQALIAAWQETHRQLLETYEASCAAADRARCPVPQALIATESDGCQDLWPNGADGRRVLWPKFAVGRPYGDKDVAQLALNRRVGFFHSECDRVDEIIAAWDSWQAEQKAAQERECVAEARAVWEQAVEDYHAMGARVAKLRATTMAGVIAKILAAASHVTEDELEDDAHFAILAGAALDAQALALKAGEART
jgi:anti-sigma-K factor RskA